MKTVRFIVSLLLTVTCLTSRAQQRYDLNRFTGIVSEGEIPADMRKSLDQLYGEDKQRVKEYKGRVTNRDRVLQQSYNINRLIVNGRILFGDPITCMIERIADTLLHDYPELRKELRFYTVKSPAVNAFATGQGMIFVNLGLIAQSENEAQLAFILGHEIIHYFRKHNTEELSARKHNYKKRDEELADFLRKHNRSHEMELEADTLSLRMFYIPSPYDKEVTDGVFDVLQYAYLPFGEVPIDTTMFNSPYFSLPSKCFLDTVAEISGRDDYNDSLSSHPNIKKRRAFTRDILGNARGGSQYVTTTIEEYDYLRNLARLECIRQELIYGDYVRAYYDSYVTQRQLPDNPYLDRCKAQALFAMAMAKSQTNANTSIGDYMNYEGEIQQLYHMLGRINGYQLTLVAIRELWKAHLRNPGDEELTAYCKELMYLLGSRHHVALKDFAASPEVPATDTVATPAQEAKTNDKYAKIRQKVSSKKEEKANNMAFTDFLMADDSFGTLLEECLSADKKPKDQKENMKEGDALIVFAPFYGVISDKDNAVKYRKSDALEEQMVGYVDEAAKSANLRVVDFSDPELRSHSDVDFYNDFVAINEWTNEYLISRDLNIRHLTTQKSADALSDKYNASYLSLNAVGNAENQHLLGFSVGVWGLLASAVVFPALPPVLLGMLGHKQHTYTENMVIDIRNAQTVSKFTNDYSFKDNPVLVQNDIYETMQKAKGIKAPTGLMGRRFMVGAGVGLSFPVLKHLVDDGIDAHIFDFRPSLEMGFVTKRSQSLNLWLDYNPTKFDLKGKVPEANANIVSAALTYRWALSECSMPLGTYFGAGLQGSLVHLSPVNENLQPINYRGGIQLELGRTYAISKKMTFNFGIRYTLTIANAIQKSWNYDYSQGYYEDLIAEYNRELEKVNLNRAFNRDLWATNFMMIHIGLGFLPF